MAFSSASSASFLALVSYWFGTTAGEAGVAGTAAGAATLMSADLAALLASTLTSCISLSFLAL